MRPAAVGSEEMLPRLARIWDQIWFTRFDPVSIGMFRIFLGGLMILFYLALTPNWDRFYAADGIASLNQFSSPSDGWSLFRWTGFLPIRIFWLAGLVTAVLFTIGWHTRFCTIVLFALECSLLNRSPMAMNGEDVVFRMLLFWSMFAPLGYSLSLDAKHRRQAGGVDELPLIWPVRAMQINFLMIYAISLPNKLADDVAWWTGDAVYLSIISNMWSGWPWPGMFYAFDGFLSKVFTYGTIFVEGSFPILVWFRRTRMPIIVAVACLHLGITVILNGVTFFSLAMVCALWIFVPPEVTRRVLQWRE